MADSNMPPPITMLDLAPILSESGPRLVDPAQLRTLFNAVFSTGSVPATGNSQVTAAPLNNAVNFVPSAAAANYGLLLPKGILGRQIIVVNGTTVALSVFANGSDFVIPSGAGVPSPSAPQQGQTTAAYICIAMVPAAGGGFIFYWKQAAPV